jgi:8-amino-7-oxononanoate synthase
VKCFRFWKALFEAGVFTNPVIPPAVESGRALIRTSFQATHTDAHLAQVLDAFERVGRKLDVIPSTRPTTWVPVSIARPGTGAFTSRPAASRSGARNVLSGGPLGGLFETVESLTWRAASLPTPDLRRMASAPLDYLRERGRELARRGIS